MYKNVYLIQSQDLEQSEIDKIVSYVTQNYNISPQVIAFENFDENDLKQNDTLYICYLNKNDIKSFLSKVVNSETEILILPNKECEKVVKSYNLISDYKQALHGAFDKQNLTHVDMLTANNFVVLNSVILGDVYGINSEVLPDDSFWKKIKRFFRNLKKVSFKTYKIKTANQSEVDTVATGILVYEHNVKAAQNSLINEDISLHDGRLNAMILAPKSIFSYLYLLFVIYYYHRFSLSKLPKSIGLIKSKSIEIHSTESGIDYVVDDVAQSAKEVELTVHKDALKLHLGENIDQDMQKNSLEDEESLKINHLPRGEYKNLLLKKSLPLFAKAQTDDFKDLLVALKEAAVISPIYIVLMVFSTLIATVGLFLNSGPVIIGAMILAPLMAPIVSLSMGVVRNDERLLKGSIFTIVGGVLLAVLASSIFTVMMPTLLHTSQIDARLQPNLLDMFVAIFSGVAAAYANAKEEVAKSLAGVAIAVALVPPLAVTGIGLGWMDYEVIKGSFLLFITNLVGITVASSLTFVILGYAPIKRAKKGILYTSLLLGVIAIPLTFAFFDIVWQNVTHKKITQESGLNTHEHIVEYKIIDVEKVNDSLVKIELELTTKQSLEKAQLLAIKQNLKEILNVAVELKVTTKLII